MWVEDIYVYLKWKNSPFDFLLFLLNPYWRDKRQSVWVRAVLMTINLGLIPVCQLTCLVCSPVTQFRRIPMANLSQSGQNYNVIWYQNYNVIKYNLLWYFKFFTPCHCNGHPKLIRLLVDLRNSDEEQWSRYTCTEWSNVSCNLLS